MLKGYLAGEPGWEELMRLVEQSTIYGGKEQYSPVSSAGLRKVQEHLAQGPIPARLATFLADDLARAFRADLLMGGTTPDKRRTILTKSKAVGMKAQGLLGEWNALDSTTLASIKISWMLQRCGANGTRMAQEYDNFDGYFENLARTLQELQAAADQVRDIALQNKGGGSKFPKSARVDMGIKARKILDTLGLKSGCNPGGPLSDFLQLVNEAATGEETSPWANKVAEAVVAQVKKGRTIPLRKYPATLPK